VIVTFRTILVWKLDRLGRTVKGLVDFVMELAERGIQFKSLTDSIDTGTPSGCFFFHVMASLAQMERELIVERTQAGLITARGQGRIGGRKRLMTDSKIESAKTLLAKGVSPKEVARNIGVTQHLEQKCLFIVHFAERSKWRNGLLGIGSPAFL
jgi:DNA invertase Pin-like site-specific DNA recombinase